MSETKEPEEIIVPKEVLEIFDLADEASEYSALICPDSVKLTSRDGSLIYREVKWKDALKWGRNAMQIIAKNTLK
jgi:hypothetical protein